MGSTLATPQGAELLGATPIALGLVLLGLALLVAELAATSHGLLALLGLAGLAAGCVLLTGTTAAWLLPLLLPPAAVLAAAAVWLAARAAAAQRQVSAVGPEALLGRRAEALTPLGPDGWVFVDGERWEATLRHPGAAPVAPRSPVRVVAVHGRRLIVEEASGGARLFPRKHGA